MLGSIFFSFVGDSGVVLSLSLLNFVVSYQSVIKLRGGVEVIMYFDDDFLFFLGIEGVFLVVVVFIVELFYCEDLVDVGDFQFDQLVLFNELKFSGVQENCLFLIGLMLFLLVLCVLVGGVGVVVREFVRLKVVMMLGFEG